MSEHHDEWQKQVAQKLFQLECNQIALAGIVAFLGEKLGMNPAGMLKMIQMGQKATYQRRLERVEALDAQVAADLDLREDGEAPVLPADFGIDEEWLKRLEELLKNQ